jgi:hypothetical protein
MRALRIAGLLALLLVPPAARAQQNRPGFILAVDPAGFLQFGPTVEMEFSLGPFAGLDLGVRVPSLGMLALQIDEEMDRAALGTASVRFYFDRTRKPAGWLLGPRFEIGQADSGGEIYLVKGGGLEVGHRWLFGSLPLYLGAFAGGFKSESGLTGAMGAGVLSIGLAL